MHLTFMPRMIVTYEDLHNQQSTMVQGQELRKYRMIGARVPDLPKMTQST